MALNRHLSLQRLGFLLLIMVGGQGKSFVSFLGSTTNVWTPQCREVSLEVRSRKPLWRPYVFDQKGTTLIVNVGSSPAEGGLVVAAGFTEECYLVWTEVSVFPSCPPSPLLSGSFCGVPVAPRVWQVQRLTSAGSLGCSPHTPFAAL